VVAGSFTPMPAPTNVAIEPGDATILVRWNASPGAAGYILERSTNPIGIFRRVNTSKYSIRVKHHLNGDTLIPSQEGMIDFQRYDDFSGKPIAHIVNATLIFGPRNGVRYYYRVRTIDLFNRPGAPSPVVNTIPVDSTKPSIAPDIVTTVDDAAGSVTLRWTQVVKDINAHWEQPDSSVRYRIYRFASSLNPDSVPAVFLGEVGTIKGQQSRDTIDADPSLRASFGNRTWWYRIRSVDTAGNISDWSSAVSAVIKDITPPAIVKNVTAVGFEDSILVKWQLNTEPDIANYEIYRSLCHLGDWVECSEKIDSACRAWITYDPDIKDKQGKPGTDGQTGGPRNPTLPCPCSGPFIFLGTITHDSASRAQARGNFFFEDRTIPDGSPLCYAYWIKAKDSSDNRSGTWPLPNAAERAQIVCQRLRDRTPPEAALISGLYAQADKIRVEWMGPPTQDTRAFHVYRATGTNPSVEPNAASYVWVGGMTVELPPTLPVELTSPYTAPTLAACDKISVQATPWMSQGHFEDRHVDPKLTYWYKVVGIDYDGNETDKTRAAAISTFTFTGKTPDAPVLDVIAKQPDPCAVTLQWSPSFDPNVHAGFIIYRSSVPIGPFTPIVICPVKGNSFVDNNVVNGQTYYYRIGIMFKNGRLSNLTAIQSITL
jgi:hypothetical protein